MSVLCMPILRGTKTTLNCLIEHTALIFFFKKRESGLYAAWTRESVFASFSNIDEVYMQIRNSFFWKNSCLKEVKFI